MHLRIKGMASSINRLINFDNQLIASALQQSTHSLDNLGFAICRFFSTVSRNQYSIWDVSLQWFHPPNSVSGHLGFFFCTTWRIGSNTGSCCSAEIQLAQWSHMKMCHPPLVFYMKCKDPLWTKAKWRISQGQAPVWTYIQCSLLNKSREVIFLVSAVE